MKVNQYLNNHLRRNVLSKSVKIQWNEENQNNGFIKHQMDSLDYWSSNIAKERDRVRYNLINNTNELLELPNRKIPPNLFSTSDFYEDLHKRNSAPNDNYRKRVTALKNWKKRNYGNFKIKNKPMNEHFRFFEKSENAIGSTKEIWKVPGVYRPHKERPSTDSELQNLLNSKYRMEQRKSSYHEFNKW